ncbi:hypothetical protein GCM10022393_19910 [Aquimarina addita]|uniref:Uncharacterized protein n=1 Tax=Aquimarina addita TaxID=870485 RepID=A0ABP6UHY2_9FLAO
MENKDFNPIIEAVVSIRNYATVASSNWSNIKKYGSVISNNIEKAYAIINNYSSEDTKKSWIDEMLKYANNLSQLQEIMNAAIHKIKNKKADRIFEDWNEYPKYVIAIEKNYSTLKNLGFKSAPENEKENWQKLWDEIITIHLRIKNEAEACSIQLKLIEDYKIEDIDELTDTILKHIPLTYSIKEANKYEEEYLEAYKAIKKEASQKKNLWDRFLDILAGGVQQTPAQRVMMQRWVDGEKGELH